MIEFFRRHTYRLRDGGFTPYENAVILGAALFGSAASLALFPFGRGFDCSMCAIGWATERACKREGAAR